MVSDEDTLLSRAEVSARLGEIGFPVPVATLATMATRGGGPAYQRFGRHVLYRWGTARAWAVGRLSSPRSNTSEADAGRAKAAA